MMTMTHLNELNGEMLKVKLKVVEKNQEKVENIRNQEKVENIKNQEKVENIKNQEKVEDLEKQEEDNSKLVHQRQL